MYPSILWGRVLESSTGGAPSNWEVQLVHSARVSGGGELLWRLVRAESLGGYHRPPASV